MATPEKRPPELGIAGSIAQSFVNSKLTPLIILFDSHEVDPLPFRCLLPQVAHLGLGLAVVVGHAIAAFVFHHQQAPIFELGYKVGVVLAGGGGD